MSNDRAVCLHYAVERKTGCEMGRIAPRDCDGCAAYEPDPCAGQVAGIEDLDASERTRCEVWTRVMGYHRPVHAFNAGKQAEHRERVGFREPK
jgi:Oxygen-sensitive ribonucleoside-triphosphate reductase